nr:membrane progestin receptor beta isoform X1 [Vulpes vulpes]
MGKPGWLAAPSYKMGLRFPLQWATERKPQPSRVARVSGGKGSWSPSLRTDEANVRPRDAAPRGSPHGLGARCAILLCPPQVAPSPVLVLLVLRVLRTAAPAPAAMTTAILERLSTLSVSGQQLRRLPKLLEDGLPKMPCTVPETDVPQLFREPYIRTGYRPTGHEWRYYFFSLFQKHNEVVNVWTHLLAALAVLLRFWAFAEAEALPWAATRSLPLLLFILSSLTYLTCSLLAHLLQSKSELSHYTFYFVDYVGVSVYQYGSALAHFFYSSDQAWYELFWLFFLPAAAFCGWLSCAGCCYAKYRYRRPYPVMRKLCQVVPAGLAFVLDISPVAHRVALCHLAGCQEQAAWYHTLQILFFLVSAYFFSCPVPEKYFPGSCDIVGHGHQIFHAFLSVCTLSQLEAILLDYQGRQEIFLQRHGPLSVYMACLSFFFLAACSAATAALLRHKVKARLTKKDS